MPPTGSRSRATPGGFATGSVAGFLANIGMIDPAELTTADTVCWLCAGGSPERRPASGSTGYPIRVKRMVPRIAIPSAEPN